MSNEIKQILPNIERTSLFSEITCKSIAFIKPFRLKGSITVETAFVLPIFLFFFMNLSSAIEMIRLHGNLCVALWNVGKSITVYGGLLTDPVNSMGKTGHAEGTEDSSSSSDSELIDLIIGEIGDMVVTYTFVKNSVVDYLGMDYLDSAPIVDGANGLQFYESEIFYNDDVVDITMTYEVKPPVDMNGMISFRMVNRYYAHLWNGYDVTGGKSKDSEDRIVYVAKDSEVYHLSTNCTYLKLSTKAVNWESIPDQRNEDGSKYKACEECAVGSAPLTVYICDEGGKYHFSRDCYTLVKEYTEVKLSKVSKSHRPCSRCGSG